MKKSLILKKIFAGILMSSFLVMSFVSCDGLLSSLLDDESSNTKTEKEKNKDDDSSKTNTDEEKKSIYTFKLTDVKGSYHYFTSTETFKYTEAGEELTNCIYQISFNSTNTANTKGTWTIYTRPKASTNVITLVAKGSYEGNPEKSGTITLTYEAGGSAGSVTVSGEAVKKGLEWDYTGLTFSMDVTKLHSTIGAVDEK